MTKNITIAVSDDLAKKMEGYPEINWSEVCRQGINNYIEEKEPKQKGELVRELENCISGKLPSTEDKERVRKEEIERFTKKWGDADNPYPTEFTPPYVELRKKQEIKHGDRTIARLQIGNRIGSGVSIERVIELDEKGWGKYNKELYPKEIQQLTDCFKSRGFVMAEESFTMDAIMLYVLDTYGSEGKERARNLMKRGYQYYGLFATDKEDVVFITYREVKPK